MFSFFEHNTKNYANFQNKLKSLSSFPAVPHRDSRRKRCRPFPSQEDCESRERVARPERLNSASAWGFDAIHAEDAVSEPLYLEDIFVGQRFVTGTYTMTTEAIKAFARDYDPQSFHTDELAAKDSFFCGLAASGWHTAAITMRLQIDSGPKIGGGMIGASGELSWPKPTRPGDVLHVESEVMEVKPSKSKPERGFVTLKSETKNQKGEVVQLFVVKLLVWRRPEYGF
jgi:acyl dehydratase